MRILTFFIAFCVFACAVANALPKKLPESRIISGTPAAPGQFPWQVILKRDEIDDLLCGASVIADVWVLTAAHCTYGLRSIYMVFGTTLLDDLEATRMTSTEIYVHPRYQSDTLSNDVSLIKLPDPLAFTVYIRPITLVSSAQSSNTFENTQCTIAGFGLIDDEYLDYSPNLLYAQVVIINNSKCAVIFGDAVVTSSTLCATGANGSSMSICSGDSGGPLITRDDSGNWIQIGINSFVAQDMCTEGYPSGYVRLTDYLSYISDVTGINYKN